MEVKDDNPGADRENRGFRHLVRALSSRNYRLFFTGQGLSVIGNWITRIATSWLVYKLTGSTLLLGVIGFAGQIPVFILSPFAGVWVDRWDHHRILLVTQALSAVESLALAFLALTGMIQVWHLIALVAFQGVINAFDMPTRQAFVLEMVEHREDLGNAIALNSSMVNGARLIGPSVAGIMIASVGEGWCFLLDGISYVAVIGSLLAMRFAEKPPREVRDTPVWAELKEGLTYAYEHRVIRATLMLLALVSIMGMPYSVLMPVFATKILHGGPPAYGFLMSASGIGALGGAAYLASRRSVVGLGKVIPIASGVFGIGLIAFGLSRALWLSLAILIVTGFGFMVQMASSNTILQTVVEEEKRGRVMSLYTMAFIGVTPFGSLMAGVLAERIGAAATVVLGGVACIIAALLFARELPALRKILRPFYISQGILPAEPETAPVTAPESGP
jgi:MFS family permease